MAFVPGPCPSVPARGRPAPMIGPARPLEGGDRRQGLRGTGTATTVSVPPRSSMTPNGDETNRPTGRGARVGRVGGALARPFALVTATAVL